MSRDDTRTDLVAFARALLIDSLPQRIDPPAQKPRTTMDPVREALILTGHGDPQGALCQNCHAEPATKTTDTVALYGPRMAPAEPRRVCAGCYVFPRSYPQRMGYRPRSGEPPVAASLHPDDPEPLMCDNCGKRFCRGRCGPADDPTPRWERY